MFTYCAYTLFNNTWLALNSYQMSLDKFCCNVNRPRDVYVITRIWIDIWTITVANLKEMFCSLRIQWLLFYFMIVMYFTAAFFPHKITSVQ